MTTKTEWTWRPLPVARLIELLQLLEPDDQVACNDIANLSIERHGEYVGFVDFWGGRGGIVPFMDRIEAVDPDESTIA